MLGLLLGHAPVLSLATALIARVLAIRIKSRLAFGSPEEACRSRILHASIGVLAKEDLSTLIRHLGHSLSFALGLKSLDIVWMNAVDSFETIEASDKIRIRKWSEKVQVDIVIDVCSFFQWMSVGEI
jgi:hypothetical protein